MRDAFSNQNYEVKDTSIDRQKVQHKLTKNTIVFGIDKTSYFKSNHSRAESQELSKYSQDAKNAAENVKNKLRADNFKFGSHKIDYRLSSHVDKALCTQDPLMHSQQMKKGPKVNSKMYSTQSSWNNTQKLKFRSHNSKNKLPTKEYSFQQELKDKLAREKPIFPDMNVDKNELIKSSIKLGDSNTFNELSTSHSK